MPSWHEMIIVFGFDVSFMFAVGFAFCQLTVIAHSLQKGSFDIPLGYDKGQTIILLRAVIDK